MSFSFGAPSSAPNANVSSFSFSTPNKKPLNSSLASGGGGGLNFSFANNASSTPKAAAFGTQPATSAAPTTGFTLGAPAAAAAPAPLSNFSFGAPTSLGTSASGLTGFNTTSTAQTGLFGTTATSTPATSAPKIGLGGITTTLAGVTGPINTLSDPNKDSPKNNALPAELLATVTSFKEFVKKQKAIGSDLMRLSSKPFHEVTVKRNKVAAQVAGMVCKINLTRSAAKHLRENARKTLQAVESAGSAYYSEGPPELLWQVMTDLENQFKTISEQMSAVQTHLKSQPKLLTQEDLYQGISRIFESLVAVAGRLQMVHSQVLALKSAHLELRRRKLNSNVDIFTKPKAAICFGSKEPKVQKNKTLVKNVLDMSQRAGPTSFTYLTDSFLPTKAFE